MVDMVECALKHVETQMDNLLLAMGDDPLSPEVVMCSLCRTVCIHLNYGINSMQCFRI